MREIRRVVCLLALFLCLLPFGYVQEKEQKPEFSCKTESPLYVDENNNPILLDSKKMKDRAIQCEAPQWPAMERLRINGNVALAILVDPTGAVENIKVISGHPLLREAAINAAKKWKFKPMKENEKAVAFCGMLIFHITMGISSDHTPDPCLCGHW